MTVQRGCKVAEKGLKIAKLTNMHVKRIQFLRFLLFYFFRIFFMHCNLLSRFIFEYNCWMFIYYTARSFIDVMNMKWAVQQPSAEFIDIFTVLLSNTAHLLVQWQYAKPAQIFSGADTKTVPPFKMKGQCAGNKPNPLVSANRPRNIPAHCVKMHSLLWAQHFFGLKYTNVLDKTSNSQCSLLNF